MKKVQQALIDCGFDLGEFGAGGDFGHATEGAVKQFQTHYEPTHTTHKSYQFGDIDGIVGKNTILALDEAVVEEWKYSFVFTLEMLRAVYPRVSSSKQNLLQGIVDELNDHIEFYKLDTPLRRTHFFAQIMQETGSSLSMEESFRYSFNGLVNTYKRFEENPSLAKALSYDETVKGKNTKRNGEPLSSADFEKIANIAYGSRMGNTDDGDGWKYRGRGLKQLTGKYNYNALAQWHQKNSGEWPEDANLSFVEEPDLLLEIKYAVRSAAFFWVSNKLYQLADNGAGYPVSKSITEVVNLHTDSYQQRFKNFNQLYSKEVFE
ncbi:peptidoglycan-binding protein [Vibrio zhanjiangensis]|uniref:peptidoglycan-binding protein n=1 Tax=Vibrio zhanjiangensis TaxID=1046128 RepID=UPI0032B00637